MNTRRYLERIGIEADHLEPTAGTLRLLHRQHLLTVPFENLDIHWKRPITLDTDKFYQKIVDKRRGGFCYELNGLFNELLREIGFSTRLVSARVFNGSEYGPEFDHAAIIVRVGDDEYLADVGFGDFTFEPLRFELNVEQSDREGTFVLRPYDADYIEIAKRDGDDWTSEYIFRDIARELAEFSEMCDFQQYSPESHFTKKKVCSIVTADGRKTLTDSKLVLTANGVKAESEVRSDEHFDQLLADEFGVRRIQ